MEPEASSDIADIGGKRRQLSDGVVADGSNDDEVLRTDVRATARGYDVFVNATPECEEDFLVEAITAGEDAFGREQRY